MAADNAFADLLSFSLCVSPQKTSKVHDSLEHPTSASDARNVKRRDGNTFRTFVSTRYLATLWNREIEPSHVEHHVCFPQALMLLPATLLAKFCESTH